MDVDLPTLLMAIGSAGVFGFLGQLVQSYVTRKQGVDGASVDLQKSKLGDAAAFRVELQKRDTELNARIDALREQIDTWQSQYHETNAEKTLLEREVATLEERVRLLEESNARLRAENQRLREP